MSSESGTWGFPLLYPRNCVIGTTRVWLCEVPSGPARGRPGDGAAEEPGPREPGKGLWRCRRVRTQLKSEGRRDGQAVRIQGSWALREAGFRGLHAPLGGSRSRVILRRRGGSEAVSPRPSSREEAAPGSRLGWVSGPWSCDAPGRGEDI
ncbi:unnamed protein product [Rangifer tarandus platyrhynchus]|uniref:Uncharacterized protein n=1 Tax=Rangifer tarandus platyrhynchus TaxID=3082113 RepID=A0ABN8ZLS5_RANTA|nr:unnamed protein product [Rangifer tarandus platyrhynchus]